MHDAQQAYAMLPSECRLTVAFHVLHQGLGPALELTHNPQWGEHCRKEALATAAMVDKHLSDGRNWIIGGNEPTFADITLCTAVRAECP